MFIDLREREKYQSVVSQTYPDQELNPKPFSALDNAPTH